MDDSETPTPIAGRRRRKATAAPITDMAIIEQIMESSGDGAGYVSPDIPFDDTSVLDQNTYADEWKPKERLGLAAFYLSVAIAMVIMSYAHILALWKQEKANAQLSQTV